MVRKTMYTNKLEQACLAVAQKLCVGNGNDPLVAYPAAHAERIHKLILGLAEGAKYVGGTRPSATGITVPQNLLHGETFRLLSDWAHRAGEVRVSSLLTNDKLPKFVLDYAALCSGWGCQPELTEHPTNPSLKGIKLIVPQFRVPMDCPYPDPLGMPVGPFELRIIFGSGTWDIIMLPITGLSTKSQRTGAVHPHSYHENTFCRGDWESRLTQHARALDLIAYTETLYEAYLMRNSSTRYLDGHGGDYQFGAWGRCKLCGQSQGNGMAGNSTALMDPAGRGGFHDGFQCHQCRKYSLVCRPCGSHKPTMVTGAQYCTKCVCNRQPAGTDIAEYWSKLPAGPAVVPPCAICETDSPKLPRCPAKKDQTPDQWVCTKCWTKDHVIIPWHKMEAPK